ncbi:MAG: hypothetical protein Q4C91_13495 [Eubacteriales bacterium]|nr:hypothetical protein [Eubacteriales bacterium]
MQEIRQVYKVAARNYSGWMHNLRVWAVFFMAFALGIMLSDEMLTYARTYETSLQILEPFIWTYGDAASVMLSSLLLVLLFADIPFISQETPYQLIRTKRSIWLTGQIVYIICTTILYNLFLFLVQAVLAMPFAFMGNVWSETAAMLGYSGISKGRVPVSVKTMESAMPYECALQVFLLMLCYSLFIASVMLFLNLVIGQGGGIFGAFAINICGYLLTPDIIQKLFSMDMGLEYRANVLCGWLSPLNHATFSMHNFGYDYLPEIGVSFGIFIGMVIILAVLSVLAMRRYDFSFMQTNE